jgi:hypothetical protein
MFVHFNGSMMINPYYFNKGYEFSKAFKNVGAKEGITRLYNEHWITLGGS